MTFDAKYFQLEELAQLQGGHPFRGSIEESLSGDVLAVQMKDVDLQCGVDWAGAIRTELGERNKQDWLQADDVLFVSRGTRFYAVCIDEPPSPAVCSLHFFRLRVKPHADLMPAFLAWQINQSPFQRQLKHAAEGSSQLSIRRPVLESLTLCVPSLADQQRIAALADLARQERHALHQLIQNRELQLQALAESLAHSAQAAH